MSCVERFAGVINDDFGLHAYKKCTSWLLILKLKAIRLGRSKLSLRLCSKEFYRRILFTVEKVFSVEEN